MNINKIISLLQNELRVNVKKDDPFRVLIRTVLSQRTKDENTRRASEQLFRRFNNPEKLANAPVREIEKLIKPSGFYKQKARRIKEISKRVLTGVPDNINELLKLPGVGRKTANCVLVFGFGKPAIPVDTHVHRISNRLGLVATKTPEETEKALTKIVPKSKQKVLNLLFVRFGQTICKPKNPKCNICPITRYCKTGRTLKHELS